MVISWWVVILLCYVWVISWYSFGDLVLHMWHPYDTLLAVLWYYGNTLVATRVGFIKLICIFRTFWKSCGTLVFLFCSFCDCFWLDFFPLVESLLFQAYCRGPSLLDDQTPPQRKWSSWGRIKQGRDH